MRVFKFLSAEYGIQALQEKRVKISRLNELNDPFEWAAPVSREVQHRAAFRSMKQEMAKDRGIFCVSRSWSNPLLWSHYANNHSGVALAFDVPDALFFPVIYRSQRVKCDWERFLSSQEYALQIVQKVFRSKFDHWKYEDEVRAHVALDHKTSENGLYFLNFSDNLILKGVILGSNIKENFKDDITAYLKDSREFHIIQARLAFQSFKIVRQRLKS